jgi:hypothetical protein
MNCPHCHKELPQRYSAGWCPFCGRDLPPMEAPALESSPPLAPVIFRPRLFFSIFLAPPLLTVLIVLLSFGSRDVQDGAALVALFGGGIAGITCGIMLGRRLGKSSATRVGFSLLLGPIMVVVCVGLSFFGCMVSGYQLSFH